MIEILINECDQCGCCISVCPVNALVLEQRLSVDPATCISCGRCVLVCGFGALKLHAKNERDEPE